MRRLLGLTFLALALTASSAFATTLAIGDANYVGSINDGIPSNPDDEASYINYLTTLAAGAGNTQLPAGTGEIYNRQGSTLAGPFPEALASPTFKDETGNQTTSVSGTYQYVVAKYDAAAAGSLVWYFSGGITGSVTVPLTYNDREVSHISFYNAASVPEGGATIGLLGLSLMGLGFLRGRIRS
jgi:hypothetical protein